LTGHSLGAAGVQEAIYTLLMMDRGFVAPSINVNTRDPEIPAINIATTTVETELKTAMSNSFKRADNLSVSIILICAF